MYRLDYSTKFRKDLKKIKNKKRDYAPTVGVLKILENSGVSGIPKILHPHKLKGRYDQKWECHIRPDLLIIWEQFEEPNVIRLERVGTHSELFK